MSTRASESLARKARPKLVLSLIVRHDNPGQLSLPTQLNLGNDGKLYLTGSCAEKKIAPDRQIISLKESVAWFRAGNQCGLNLIQGGAFSQRLQMIERALP